MVEMGDQERFFGDGLGSVEQKSAFPSDQEKARMNLLRKKIEIVRKAWLDPVAQKGLMETVRKGCMIETRPREVQETLDRLLQGHRDYADVDTGRPEKTPPEQYDALELYCSSEGYRYLFGLMSNALRTEQPSEELLLTATTMVEFLTIDLYNLRLSQIGDSRYANFQGVTYRGLSVSPTALAEYDKILANPSLSLRSFSIPLGLLSSSTEEGVMLQFAETDEHTSAIPMFWTIHIHGVDPDLLKAYQQRYPESVVTSICAMPVGRVSPFGEKEVLLRGAFFHLIGMTTEVFKGQKVKRLVVVMMNANRDHTTEQASHEGDKLQQRETFSRIVMASKYEVCASLAGQYSSSDAAGYQKLQEEKLDEIRETDTIDVRRNQDLAYARSSGSNAWSGASLFKSYPRHYAELRRQWQDAIAREDWIAVDGLLGREYEWTRGEWYNVGRLSGKTQG